MTWTNESGEACLVTSPTELDTLAVIAGELGLGTSRQLQGDIVGPAVVTTFHVNISRVLCLLEMSIGTFFPGV